MVPYRFEQSKAGLAAFVMLVWGGVQWLVSGAAPSQASEARDKVRNAIVGLLLVLASFLVIQVINPELTIIGTGDPSLVGQSSGETAEVGPSTAFKNTFLVNGRPNTTVNSGDSALLEWNIDPAFNNCDGQSDPSELWARSLSPSEFEESETVGPITSTTFFMLDCYKTGSAIPVSTILSVGIDSGGPPDPTPLVQLQVDPDRGGPLEPSDGPLFVLPNTEIDIILFSRNAAECWGGSYVPGISGETEKKTSFFVVSPPNQYIFDVTCFNSTGQSARDEVIVNVLPL